MSKAGMLFLIILVEGYVVLACELLAIRQLIPFVGSGTDTVSIIISAVLLPLAIGYHRGGAAFKRQYAHGRTRGKKPLTVRRILLKNILSALAILTPALSYPFLELFFGIAGGIGITHRLTQTALYALLFLVTPVYLLGQTVPLVSNYFSRRRLSEITGKMLFFSTAGSFLGSVFSTIVLMSFIGVHNTVIVTLGLLALLGLLLSPRLLAFETFFCLCVFALLYLMNHGGTMRALGVVSNNAYNLISIENLPDEDAKIIAINRSASSKIARDEQKHFEYWKYIETIFIRPIMTPRPGQAPRDMLVIGAGGFTVGLNDRFNRYTFVDIDKDLKTVAESHFLPEKLSPNKRFEVASARAYVHTTTQRFDFIMIDVFTNVMSVPMESTTREFLADVKKRLKPGGIVVVNMICSAPFTDAFTVRYHNTFASVFPRHSRQVIGNYDPWTPPGAPARPHNVLYVGYNHSVANDDAIYTDDRNTYSFDRN